MNAQELEALWAKLPAVSEHHLLSAERLSVDGLWAAVDRRGNCHLLLQIPEDAVAPTTVTKGLLVRVGKHQVAGYPTSNFLDLSCMDGATVSTFAAVAAEVVSAVSDVSDQDRIESTKEVLERWKWFWEVDPGRLSQNGALGLFAELWFLARWAGVQPASVSAWSASEGSRHDFQWAEASVEVKATSRGADSGSVHIIQSLDQLANPETGELYLFSLRVVRDQLANNTLPRLVDHVSSALVDHPKAREEFLQKVAKRGYSPAHRRALTTPYRIVEEGLYRIDDDFPRLTQASFPAGLPDGVVKVSYSLDMAVCSRWLISGTPIAWPPN
ncbi:MULTISPECIES: PD-(D/E)XK motif protein [unclassified Streptomyces]|uniref:PD-(D/E)XK motif protein n=1 Tax=Streptomyces TaxID=1883 RepID=UPI000D50D57F|nr:MULTISPECIES: PD-(D/E)XK motif protein [unclassified Streptomyces]PVD11854.1 hypothetical protein DBP22_03645 [Streptomyces sp. CS207]RSS05681.1 PD-(D/E)XK motif protein [Streptomyces sp. WAC04189]RSS90639.1 PD-(D/E)XK motif protein [Streptomyces sp. WAC02707]